MPNWNCFCEAELKALFGEWMSTYMYDECGRALVIEFIEGMRPSKVREVCERMGFGAYYDEEV